MRKEPIAVESTNLSNHPACRAWTQAGGGMDASVLELRGHIAQVAAAAMQAAMAGHAEEAKRILADARRALYRILAEDRPEERGEV